MFKKGQKVICQIVFGIGDRQPSGIEKDKTYTVEKVSKCQCGSSLLDLKEAQPYQDRVCPICHNPIGPKTFWAERFDKLDANNKNRAKTMETLNNWNVGELKIKYRKKVNPTFIISSPEDVWKVIMTSIPDRDELDIQEFFFAIYLNRASEVLGFKVINKGDLEGVQVNKKLLLTTALLLNATGFIVAHNHPSGQLTPSSSDVEFTNKLKQAADILDLDLVDHTIITQSSALSLRLENYVDLGVDGWYRKYAKKIEDKCTPARRLSKKQQQTKKN